MPLVLDTDTVDATDRADMMADALQRASAPAHLKLANPDRLVRSRLDAWTFGDATLTRFRGSGYGVERTPTQTRLSPSPSLLVVLVQATALPFTQAGIRRIVGPGHLFPVDLNQPYEAEWSGGEWTLLEVPLDRLTLPAETIHRALPQLESTPLCPLVANHIAYLVDSADVLEADPAAPVLGDACVEIVRALFTSAAGLGGEDGSALPADILLTQIRHYIRRHLSDPDLGPARIADAHHISVRYLYKLCARAGLRLGPWIIGQRLHRVHAELARPENTHRTIATIAYRYGFRDPSHFARRFRAAYGMTPNQWRHTALHDPSGAQPSIALDPHVT
ncbi:AraC-like DNA-binding protein [Nocardia transvalensis]|uniref:AraC-like DNA-binding protein n=1 Tax=Nocardia transvalensis TaxID=37333 RepID=A0A7W9PJM1_9NOCA|nr:AraC family transcriptional regulator [Nocardia transvalensis]MBB5917330.1 AraC-like DNA-binding protein [Nocardia transvalensis]